jgi:glucose/arabinose dehydrogenase
MRSQKVFFLSSLALLVVFALWWLQPPAFFSNKSLPLSPALTPTSGSEKALQTPSLQVESFVSDLNVPWSIVFTSPERILVTERPGRVRVVENGRLLEEPLRVFTEVSNRSEEGLMGMTLDLNYAANSYIYLCLAYRATNGRVFDKVIRVIDSGDGLIDDLVIIDGIPAAANHAGCRLRFGPDEKLYISTGDASERNLSQDLTSLAGKILRINTDGSIPDDNPFPNSAVFSYGHRNPQGFDWNPISGALIATEHGPSGNDGPGGGDEVNLIQAGQNYGWPEVSHQQSKEGMINPLLVFTPAIAPASGMFYRSLVLSQLTNTFLFGMLRGEGIMQVFFDEAGQVRDYQKLVEVEVGRVRDIVEGPDGFVYFTTSNRDGRGKARSGDDHIFRLSPTD